MVLSEAAVAVLAATLCSGGAVLVDVRVGSFCCALDTAYGVKDGASRLCEVGSGELEEQRERGSAQQRPVSIRDAELAAPMPGKKKPFFFKVSLQRRRVPYGQDHDHLHRNVPRRRRGVHGEGGGADRGVHRAGLRAPPHLYAQDAVQFHRRRPDIGAPTGFTIPIREVTLSTGAAAPLSVGAIAAIAAVAAMALAAMALVALVVGTAIEPPEEHAYVACVVLL